MLNACLPGLWWVRVASPLPIGISIFWYSTYHIGSGCSMNHVCTGVIDSVNWIAYFMFSVGGWHTLNYIAVIVYVAN